MLAMYLAERKADVRRETILASIRNFGAVQLTIDFVRAAFPQDAGLDAARAWSARNGIEMVELPIVAEVLFRRPLSQCRPLTCGTEPAMMS